MKTVRLTTAAAIVRFLRSQYVERDGQRKRFFAGAMGIFGHGNVAGLGQALEEEGEREFPFYQPKNEQAMVHTAAAFAKASLRMRTFACTTSIGPGATNMLTGAAGATINRIPVLLLPGDVFASRTPDPVLQQLEHPLSQSFSVNDAFVSVSAYWDRILRPEQILRAFPEAVRVLTDPAQTGAVTIALPQDVQAEAYDFPANFFEPHTYSIRRPQADESLAHRAVRLLKSAKCPLIVAGGGVHYSEAEEELSRFARKFGVPVAVTQAGKGALLDDHPLCLGAVGATGTLAANRIAARADIILAIGTRLSDFTTASKTAFANPRVKFVSINIHAGDAHKHGAIPLVGDARSVLRQLSASMKPRLKHDSARFMSAVREEKRNWTRLRDQIVEDSGNSGLLTQAQVIGIVNEAAGANGTMVHAAGGLPGDLHKLWNCEHALGYHSEYGYSCMGYEIAGGLGVKLARPSRDVYVLVGDGSYLMSSQEIATAVQEGLRFTIILLDNHGYQCIRKLQTSLGSRAFGNEFRAREIKSGRLTGSPLAIDYMANAGSFGATVFEASNETALRDSLRRARKSKTVSLIYVPVDPNASVPSFESFWDVPVSAVSSQPEVRKARRKYESLRKNERFYY